MISVNLDYSRPFIDKIKFQEAHKVAEEELNHVKNKTGKGPEWLGWRDILKDPNDALLAELDTLANQIRQKADIFIVAGIGGSYLGAKAVIDALSPFFPEKGPKILFAGHHMSGRYLTELVEYLSRPKPDGSKKEVYLNVISKSGTTTETALAFRILRQWMHDNYSDADKRIVCTTSAEGGALNKIIDANGYRKFVLPDDIGGRFSVLTPVGLLPIAIAGIDIRNLYYGAVSAFKEFENDASMVLDYVATRLALYHSGKAMDMIASFEPELAGMGGWMQQLYGESEGKNGKGLFPVLLGYSTDLHSVGQMVQDGQRNLIETFLVVDKSKHTLNVEADPEDTDGLNYLTGKSFHYINSKAFEGTREAHVKGGVPCISIHFDELNAENIGRFIYFCQLAIAIYVYYLGENPFDQPGVEDYKKAMFRLLGKP